MTTLLNNAVVAVAVADELPAPHFPTTIAMNP
jgi:hypothetical protein